MRVDGNTVALVTGAAGGLGREFCRRLAQGGARVVAVDRETPAGLPGDALALCADLGGVEGVTRVLEALRQRGPVNLLVNAAALPPASSCAAYTASRARELVALHCDALATLCRAALPFMLECGGGAIVNRSTLDALLPATGDGLHAAAGAFVNRFSLGLQAELAGGIRVQALCLPGGGAVPLAEADAVSASLAALGREQVLVVPGENNRALAREGLEALVRSLA